jgi:nitroimidazol reductase NimA-like FMN-containing flavoprotein (pyridoxamine 5'-phosphate oxidase superfamily)
MGWRRIWTISSSPMSQTGAMADLAELARTTLSRNRFMVLGTVDPSGRPRVSPVWFSLVDHRVAYWLSSPDARHSRNIEQRPEVSMVVFDSSADPHTGQAVYLDANAGRVPDEELGDACAEAFRHVDDELSYTSETLRDEPFVLYRARVTAWEIHVRGRDFGDGTGSDQRVPVQL